MNQSKPECEAVKKIVAETLAEIQDELKAIAPEIKSGDKSYGVAIAELGDLNRILAFTKDLNKGLAKLRALHAKTGDES